MTKKNQIYLSAFIMYLMVGLSAYLVKVTNYWTVFIISVLLCLYTLINTFSKEENLANETKVEWISVSAFVVLEAVLAISVTYFPSAGFVRSLDYTIQLLGLLFVGYSMVRYVLANTETYSYVKSKFTKSTKEEVAIENEEPVNEVAIEVQETIAQEEVKEEFDMNIDVDDVEVVGETTPEVYCANNGTDLKDTDWFKSNRTLPQAA